MNYFFHQTTIFSMVFTIRLKFCIIQRGKSNKQTVNVLYKTRFWFLCLSQQWLKESQRGSPRPYLHRQLGSFRPHLRLSPHYSFRALIRLNFPNGDRWGPCHKPWFDSRSSLSSSWMKNKESKSYFTFFHRKIWLSKWMFKVPSSPWLIRREVSCICGGSRYNARGRIQFEDRKTRPLKNADS